MTRDWFSYDPVGGFDRHATEADARAAAERALDDERADSGDGWNEHVTEICYGRIVGEVQQTRSELAPEGSEFDEIAGYGLHYVEPVSIPSKPLTDAEIRRVATLADPSLASYDNWPRDVGAYIATGQAHFIEGWHNTERETNAAKDCINREAAALRPVLPLKPEGA